MTSRAVTRGAVSVVNALATGRGASLAVDLPVEATARVTDAAGTVDVAIADGAADDPGPVRHAAQAVLVRHGAAGELGVAVETRSRVPVARGLKSSSAATGAVALATDAAVAHATGAAALGQDECLGLAVDASLKAGVTVTGAWDDACATVLGGLCVTDNRSRELVARHVIDEDVVAVIRVPPTRTLTADVRDLPYAAVEGPATVAHDLARAGRWDHAMTINGLAYGPIYDVDAAPLLAAVEAGALAASVSGTGPAVAAIAPRDRADAVADALSAIPGDTLIPDLWNDPAEVS